MLESVMTTEIPPQGMDADYGSSPFLPFLSPVHSCQQQTNSTLLMLRCPSPMVIDGGRDVIRSFRSSLAGVLKIMHNKYNHISLCL
jgi:hypothetical protein